MVSMMASIVGSKSRVAITKTANEMATTSITGGKPSRYIAKRNALYTKANPISCCIMDSIAGKAIIAPAIK